MNPQKIAHVPHLAGVRVADPTPDVSLADRANIVLKTTEGVNLIDGLIETNQGVVTLRGRVKTAAQRARAGLAVAGIDGVQGVRNLIEVDAGIEPPAIVHDTRPTDEVLKERVEAAIKSESENDKKLEGLKVTGVNHGVVHMSGQGVTMTGRLRAVELAWNAAESVEEPQEAPRT